MLTCPACGRASPADSAFCAGCGSPLGASATARESRKTVTALFCDLVGSTTLGEIHDPEVLRPLLASYFSSMRGAVERHGGRVEKYIGDAVSAVFGLPVAHEDDALRAVRAAIEMQGRLAELNAGAPIPLAARIGIMTGEVLVPGDGTPLIGDTMNTAARLQANAEPGSVLIGEPTRRLVRDAVVAEPVAPLELKGKAIPVAAYRVIGVGKGSVRVETPFVGRARQLRTLGEALDDAIEARACVLATVLAPPGVGKSRLASAFAAEVGERAIILVGQTQAYGDGITFAPLVELLSQAAGRPSGDASEVAAALHERLADELDGASVADRLASLLGVGEVQAADPSWAVRRLLEVLAGDRPVVVVLEDLHWAEPPMLDLVDAVVERIHGPVLLLCLARPELLERRPTWAAGKPRAITSTLPPLAPGETRTVAELLLGRDAPGSVVDRVCATAEGNPLYLEQLAAMLADEGLLVDGRWAGPADVEVDIPASLQALLTSRLDRLDPLARLVLERASVEGRRFRVAALSTLAPEVAARDVETALAALEHSGLVQPEDESDGRWRFAHALVVEAAYRGLSKGKRAELHEQLADWMQVQGALPADVDEAVARHLERALHLREELGLRDERSDGLATRAGELFAGAGSRAFAALDFITARDLLGRAAALLPELDRRRLDLLPNLGVALTETGRPEETEALLSKAVEQSRAAGSERDALRATIQLLSNRVYRSPTEAEIDLAVTEAEAAADALNAMGDDAGLAEAAIALEYLEYLRGHIAAQHEWTRLALHHGLAAGRFREAAQAAADFVGSAIFGPLPFSRFAATAADRLSSLRGPTAESTGLALVAVASLAADDEPGFQEHLGRYREIVDRNGLTWLGATQGLVIANVETWVGRAEAAERRLRESRDVLLAMGDIWWVSTLDSSLCAAVGAQDRPQEFLRLFDAFDAAGQQVPDPQILVRRNLLRSRALLLRGAAADAEIAARRGLELVASTDLALDHAEALLALAAALEARGLREDAAVARGQAITRLRAKGFPAAVARLETELGSRDVR